MEWSDAVERNREALRRLLSSLVAMAGIATRQPVVAEPATGPRLEIPTGDCRPPTAVTLPRHLHRAILRLLRPAEAAARRLIITIAQGLVVNIAPRRPRTPAPRSTILRNGIGTGIILPRGFVMGTPTRSAFGVATSPQGGGRLPHAKSPSPLWGGVRGGGERARRRSLALPLLDPLRLPRRRSTLAGIPRISAPGYGALSPIAIRKPISPDDPVSAARLDLRLSALAAALDDMPRHALRYARWTARRDRALAEGRRHRLGPLKPGRPPGGRLARWDPTARPGRNIREVDTILAHAHELARTALQPPDTS